MVPFIDGIWNLSFKVYEIRNATENKSWVTAVNIRKKIN